VRDAGHALAAARRRRAAARYRPVDVDLLLVAKAPPTALDRYFYFEDVRGQDALFRHVAARLLRRKPTRANKAELLAELCRRRVFLIDVLEDPFDGGSLSAHVPELVDRIRRLDPNWIVLIKADVFRAAYRALAAAGLPVSPVRVPFPSSGQQERFRVAFPRALARPRAHARTA
jgi:hypothetical protein